MAEIRTHFSSRSPVDDAVVWEGNESTADEVAEVMCRAGSALASWQSLELDERITIARRYAERLETQRSEVVALLTREIGKLPWEANAEVNASIAKVDLSIQAAAERRSEKVIEAGATQRILRYRAIGVALVLGPFNFPLHLPGGQIIPALLAGNTVVFKPSEQATAVGEWMMQAWREAGLPDGVLQLIYGGSETAGAAIDAEETGAVFLTGSRAAGRAIHQRLAGRYQVLLALELGGNNPIVVAGDADPEQTAAVVSFSAFVSAGQRCTCARRLLLIQSERTQRHIDTLLERVRSLRIGLSNDLPPPQVGPMISAKAADRLESTYKQLLELGCEPLLPLQRSSRRINLVHPAIVDASSLNQQQLTEVGEMEWFGPLLVLQRVKNAEDAIEAAANTPYGLAAAMMGGDAADFDRFVRRVGAGVVNWNRPTTGAAGAMPFGGLGESGNHRPAGYFATDFCSDPVASLESEQPPGDDPWKAAG